MKYKFWRWSKSRGASSSLIGLAATSLVLCMAAGRSHLGIAINSGERPWLASNCMIWGAMTATLANIRIIPAAPEWEEPIKPRTRFRHTTLWVLYGTSGGLGPLIVALEMASQGGLIHPSSILAFYFYCFGVSGFLINIWGKSIGGVISTVVFITTITLEQCFGLRYISDLAASPNWLICVAVVLAGLFMTAISSGHVPTKRVSFLYRH